MKKIAIIGAGQLGSRYLQGLTLTKQNISIEVVEPFEQSRLTAVERYEEMPSNANIHAMDLYDSIEGLSAELDVVIVSTNSDVRPQIVKELLAKKKVRYLVLEKVLFQTVEAYNEVLKLLKETGTQCWVNHPRRMFPFYKALQKTLSRAEQINYVVQGGAWGMGCNSLHFIDHLSFLSGNTDLALNYDALHRKIYDAKRAGFVEFNGTLNGTLGEHTFSLHCAKEFIPTTITLTSDILTMFIDESNGYIRIARKENDWKWEEMDEKIVYFQSELTHTLVEQLTQTGHCDLPKYETAMQLHIPFIQTLLRHMEDVSGKASMLCPIT